MQFDRATKKVDGKVTTLLVKVDGTTVLMHERTVRVELDRVIVVGHGTTYLAAAMIRNRTGDISGLIGWIDPDRFGKIGNRVVEIIVVKVGSATVNIGVSILWIVFDDLGIVCDRVIEVAPCQVDPGAYGMRTCQ